MERATWPKGTRPWTRLVLAAAAAFAAFVALAAGASSVHAEPAESHDPFGLELPGPTVPPVTLPPLPVTPPDPPAPGSVLPQVPGLPPSIPTITDPQTPAPAASPEVAGEVVTATDEPFATGSSESALATVRRGEMRPTGQAAVLRLAKSAMPVLLIALAAMAYLVMQSMSERRNPRLVAAPFDRRETELEFR